MKLRKARKKTRPTQKKVMLFPYGKRMEALRKAVASMNHFQDYLNELADRIESLGQGIDGWNNVKVWVDENDPTLIHVTGIPKAPVERIVIDAVISKEEEC